MKSPFVVVLAPFLALGAGCLNTSSSRSRRPEDWIAATKPVPHAPVDISGTYRLGGENRGVRNLVGSPLLAELFFVKKDQPAGAREVQLLQHGKDTLEIVVRGEAGVLARKSVAISTVTESATVSLPLRNASFAQDEFLGAFVGATSISLSKGSDGFLYAHFETTRVGTMLVIVPVAQSEEGWMRWPPAALTHLTLPP